MVMVTWEPTCEQKDRHECKHFLPTTSLADGNKKAFSQGLTAHLLIDVWPT